MKGKLQSYCNICSRRSIIIAPCEEHEWDQMALAYEDGWKEVIE